MLTALSLAKSDVFRTRETPSPLANQIAVSKFSSDASATPTKKLRKIMHIFPIFRKLTRDMNLRFFAKKFAELACAYKKGITKIG